MVPSLDIVIVNWNAGRQLRECLDSLAEARTNGFRLRRVVVVDNASTDGSANGLECLCRRHGLPLLLIRNETNLGFGAACNQGARDSESDYLLFLNPDTRIFPDSLRVPVRFMELPENRQVGICGVQMVDGRGSVKRSCARFPGPALFLWRMLGLDVILPRWFPNLFMTEWGHGEDRQVDHVMGAFYLVRTSLFAALGGFDERFFVYLEDLDFSLRARRAGWSSYYLARARIYHEGGGASRRVLARRLFYSLWSRILYSYKHFGLPGGTGVLLGTLFIEPCARLLRAAGSLSFEGLKETIGAYALLWRALPGILIASFRK